MGNRRMRQIYVHYSKQGSSFHQFFSDWYNFADWLGEENRAGFSITIHKWEYK